MTPHDKRERAIDDARRIIDGVCTTAGCTGLGDAITLGHMNSLGGSVVILERQPMACEGLGPVSLYCDMYGLGGAPIEDGRRMILQEAVRMCRAHLRTRAIKGPPSAADPLWAHDIHPLALSSLRHFGLADCVICRVDGSFSMRTPSMLRRIVRNASGDTLIVEAAENKSGRITVMLRLSMRDGTVITVDTMDDDPRIIIKETAIPDTARVTLIGQTIDRLLGHPCFEGTGVTITEISDTQEGGIDVRLERGNVQIAPAPDDADLTWMSLDV